MFREKRQQLFLQPLLELLVGPPVAKQKTTSIESDTGNNMEAHLCVSERVLVM